MKPSIYSIDNFSLTGASGYNEVDYYNIDKQASKVLTLKDLFNEGTDFKLSKQRDSKTNPRTAKGRACKLFEDEELVLNL